MVTDEVQPAPEHFDVIVVGAGISGIDAGYHLQRSLPEKSYAILEARGQIGGTWDLFRYPGIRSDSDMYTLGFPFRPWASDRAIVDGTSIRTYVQETAREYGIDERIRFHHRMLVAEWSTDQERWTLEIERADSGERIQLTCSFLFMCSGYYSYDQGYSPEFPGAERFRGQIVHPQFWRDDVDYAGKRVVVIGSGATAVTLVPALAQKAEHVTMLQRSPSYLISLPAEDQLARAAQTLLTARRAYSLIRWKNVLTTTLFFQLSRRLPELVKTLIRLAVKRRLPAGYDVDTHFTPAYNPWDQRVCVVPDHDLFEAIGSGRASVVTDQIETFTETGIRLATGGELAADLIITATGLILQPLGGAALIVDGRPVEPRRTMIYRGCMFTEIPNLAMVFGYMNASWTLKADLVSQFVVRLLRHMDERSYVRCVPRNPDPTMATEPLVDFSSGYLQRALPELPKQGAKRPWRLNQNYLIDAVSLRVAPIEDGALEFAPPVARRSADDALPAAA